MRTEDEDGGSRSEITITCACYATKQREKNEELAIRKGERKAQKLKCLKENLRVRLGEIPKKCHSLVLVLKCRHMYVNESEQKGGSGEAVSQSVRTGAGSRRVSSSSPDRSKDEKLSGR